MLPSVYPVAVRISFAVVVGTAIATMSPRLGAEPDPLGVESHDGVAAGHPIHHALYVDALGKGGLWGIGYDATFRERFSIGFVGSFYMLGGDRFYTASPYVGVYPARGDRHAWFLHLGPQMVVRDTPSPVPEWSGMTSTSFCGELSTGYEYQRGVLFRAYAMVTAGARLVPGLGISVGWRR